MLSRCIQQRLSAVYADSAFSDHGLGNGIDLLAECARSHRHLTGMEGHVSSLDALSRQSTQGRQVLRQPYTDGHPGQFCSRMRPQDLEGDLSDWMHARRATHGAQGKR